MDIREFRTITNDALRMVGLEEHRLPRVPRRIKAWQLPGKDLIRFFAPHAYRRPWGFVFSGFIGIDIPDLRRWLITNKASDEAGVFHTCFVGYNIANEDGLRDFMVEHDQPITVELWAELLRDRLERIPETVDQLMLLYRSNREELGWLAHPSNKPMWDFFDAWLKGPKSSIHVPRMSPNGQIS
jgi:hypothetical protein